MFENANRPNKIALDLSLFARSRLLSMNHLLAVPSFSSLGGLRLTVCCRKLDGTESQIGWPAQSTVCISKIGAPVAMTSNSFRQRLPEDG
jgi:hypothetical protein